MYRLIALVAMSAPAYARPLVIASVNPGNPPELEPHEATARAPVSEDGAIHVAPPSDPRVAIARSETSVREVGDQAIVTITLTAVSTALLWHDTELVVSVPRVARVIGLALEQGGRMQDAELLLASTARERYEDNLRVTFDPAMIELEAHGADYDRLTLSMYPVSNEQHATVKLTIAVPRYASLVVDVAGERYHHRAGAASKPTSAERALLGRPGVTGGRSLYIAPPDAPPTASEIRNQMLVTARGRAACNADGGNLDLVAHFTIATDGTVTVTGMEPTTAELAECVTHAIESWRFHRSPRPLSVRYPIHLGPP